MSIAADQCIVAVESAVEVAVESTVELAASDENETVQIPITETEATLTTVDSVEPATDNSEAGKEVSHFMGYVALLESTAEESPCVSSAASPEDLPPPDTVRERSENDSKTVDEDVTEESQQPPSEITQEFISKLQI